MRYPYCGTGVRAMQVWPFRRDPAYLRCLMGAVAVATCLVAGTVVFGAWLVWREPPVCQWGKDACYGGSGARGHVSGRACGCGSVGRIMASVKTLLCSERAGESVLDFLTPRVCLRQPPDCYLYEEEYVQFDKVGGRAVGRLRCKYASFVGAMCFQLL